MPIRALSERRSGKREPVRRESPLELIGRTPLVRLGQVTADIAPNVQVWAKLEFMNPGGSNKDRAARQILQDARERGDLVGRRVLDATTGNIGVAYAMLGAALDQRVTLVMPENTPWHLVRRIKLFGAEVVLSSPTDGIGGAIELAQALADEHPDQFWFADQHSNPSNPAAHRATADEIWEQTGGRATHFVAGIGTTGTFVGTTRRLREHRPDLKAYACESVAGPDAVSGLRSLDAVAPPSVYERDLCDQTIQCTREDAHELAMRLAATEGIACGPASGAAVWAALHVAAELKEGLVVTIIGDHFDRSL